MVVDDSRKGDEVWILEPTFHKSWSFNFFGKKNEFWLQTHIVITLDTFDLQLIVIFVIFNLMCES